MVENLGKIYPEDLDCEICPEEMWHFSKLVDGPAGEGIIKIPSALEYFQFIHDNKLNSVFANSKVACYGLYSCLLVADCSAEKSFLNIRIERRTNRDLPWRIHVWTL